MNRIGVLALQGAFAEHIAVLLGLETDAVPVRLRKELRGLDGLVIPGGESTTIGSLMGEYDLASEVGALGLEGMPILGTCAGMIMLARRVLGANRQSLGLIDIAVRRNAFGRQVDSFEADLFMPVLGAAAFHGVFIRAPWIESVGPEVDILARLPDGTPVAAQQGRVLVSSFHPELTSDARLHAYFLSIVRGNRCSK